MRPASLAMIVGLVSALFGADAATARADQPAAEIRTSQTDQNVTFRAVVVPHGRQLHGRYKMTVEKSGTSGRSSINQGGAFEARGDTDNVVVLTTSRVSRAPDDQLKAELTVTLSDGTVYTDSYVEDQSD